MRFLAVVALWSSVALAQHYVISTYAGGALPLPAPAPGSEVAFGVVSSIATDDAGNVYFTSGLNSVLRLDPDGILTRVAGNSRWGFSGDGGAATNARLRLRGVRHAGLAVDGAGNLFIVDSDRIRRVSADGIIATVAGTGTAGYSGDNGPAVNAQLSSPWDIAADRSGNIFLADGSNRVRKISSSGIITTVAGDGSYGFSGDGGPATSAQLNGVIAVAVDDAGNLFISDYHNHRIRKVSSSGIISTVAGDGTSGFSGDGGPAASAQLTRPGGLAVDEAGNLYIADSGNYRIRRISSSGIITTVAGTGRLPGIRVDGGPATSAELSTHVVSVDRRGNLFITDGSRIRKVSPNGIITTTVAGSGSWGSSGDGGPATGARLQLGAGDPFPYGDVAVDGEGNLFIADTSSARIRRVSPDGIISTVAGNGTSGFSGDGGPATSAQLRYPTGVAVDGVGNLFIAENFGRVRKVSPSGIITTVAGTGFGCYSGDGGPATDVALCNAFRVAVDRAGNLLIVEANEGRIRKVSPDGIITTVARGGATAVAVDGAGNLFIADAENYRIRKVSPDGIITTVAGNGTSGSSGDGGPATSAALNHPTGVAVDGAGNLFIATADYEELTVVNHRIRKVSPSGIITTVAGSGAPGFSGDGGLATSAELSFPSAVAVDGAGNVYIADALNDAVRILRPADKSVLISAVVDAASQRSDPVSPGKIVVIYGGGLGPSTLIQNQPANGVLSTALGGTAVFFNGIPALLLYTSDAQVAAIVPYSVTGTTAQVTVAYQGEVSASFTVPVTASAPSLFTLNQTGAGQAAAINSQAASINSTDGTANTAVNPVKIGGYISLYATGEGQTSSESDFTPVLQVRVTVGGIPAAIQFAGRLPGQVAGLMQVKVQIPSGVRPGGYVPVVLQVGDRSSSPAVWIAVAN